jgi:hypothetical protein
MLKAVKVLVIGALVLFAYTQPAMSREFADIYEDCGLGAMIAPKNPAVAAVTNVTWDSGTTAITSNSSSPDTCSGGKEKTAAFIHETFDFLESDLASGNGTYLDTLTVLTGHEEVKQDFLAALRNDFSQLVAAQDYTNKSRFEKAEALYNLVYKSS